MPKTDTYESELLSAFEGGALKSIATNLNNLISSNIPNFTAMPVDWKWAEVEIHIIKNS